MWNDWFSDCVLLLQKKRGRVMKTLKKMLYSLVLSMMIVLVSPTILPLPGQITQVEAAVKISKKTVTLIKGQTATLKISGTKKKVKWASDKKSVAVVSQKGKVVAKKKGNSNHYGYGRQEKIYLYGCCSDSENEQVNAYFDQRRDRSSGAERD